MENKGVRPIAEQLRVLAEARLKQDKVDLEGILAQARKAANEGLFEIAWEHISRRVWNELIAQDFDVEETIIGNHGEERVVRIKW